MFEIFKRKIILWYYSKKIKNRKYNTEDLIKIAALKGIINSSKTNKEKTKLFKNALYEISKMGLKYNIK